MASRFCLFLSLTFFVSASITQPSLFDKIAVGIHSGFSSFILSNGYPDLISCSDSIYDTIIKLKNTVIFIKDAKEYYKAGVMITKAVSDVMEQIYACKKLPEMFAEIVDSMKRFKGWKGIPMYLWCTIDNFQWKGVDIIR